MAAQLGQVESDGSLPPGFVALTNLQKREIEALEAEVAKVSAKSQEALNALRRVEDAQTAEIEQIRRMFLEAEETGARLAESPLVSANSNELNWQVGLLESQNAELESKIDQLASQEAPLARQVEQLRAEIARLPRHEEVEKTAEVVGAEAAVQALRERAQELQTAISSAEREELQLKSEWNTLNTEARAKERTLLEIKEKLDLVNQEHLDEERRIDQEVSSLRENLKSTENRIAQAKEDLRRAEDRNRTLEREKLVREEFDKEQQTTLRDLQTNIDALRKELGETNKKLTELEREQKTRREEEAQELQRKEFAKQRAESMALERQNRLQEARKASERQLEILQSKHEAEIEARSQELRELEAELDLLKTRHRNATLKMSAKSLEFSPATRDFSEAHTTELAQLKEQLQKTIAERNGLALAVSSKDEEITGLSDLVKKDEKLIEQAKIELNRKHTELEHLAHLQRSRSKGASSALHSTLLAQKEQTSKQIKEVSTELEELANEEKILLNEIENLNLMNLKVEERIRNSIKIAPPYDNPSDQFDKTLKFGLN